MDNILDIIWSYIESGLIHMVSFFENLISPLEIFGPGVVIFMLAMVVVLFTRLVTTRFKTKRYVALKKEYEHWQGIRTEAMKHSDQAKAKALAKNIDQAELNKAYYDYFFEGMLKNMLTNVLPILLTAAFVSKVYTRESLMDRFGDKWVYVWSFGTSTIQVSSLFWFVISILTCFILYAVIKKITIKKREEKSELVQNNI